MKRLVLTLVLSAVLFAVSAAVASAKVPGFGTEDTCACGGAVLSSKFPIGGGWCVYTWDRGPGASPRYDAQYAPC